MRVLELKNVHFWPFSEKRAKMEVFGLQHSHFSDFGHETKIWNSNMDHLEQLLLKAFCSPMKFFFQLSLYIVQNSFANSTAIFAQNQQKIFFGGFQPHMKRLITRQFDFKNFIGTYSPYGAYINLYAFSSLFMDLYYASLSISNSNFQPSFPVEQKLYIIKKHLFDISF